MEDIIPTFIGGGLTFPPAPSTEAKEMFAKKDSRSVCEQSVTELLSNLTVRHILTPKNILVVQARENVATLLQRLRDSQLRCALVYDTEKLFLGFVDAFDVVTHVLNVTGWNANVSEESFQALDWQAQKFATEPSGSLINISNADPFETISPDVTLREAVDIMARGVHRLAVVENGTVVNIVSQWDILMLVLARVSFLGTAVEKTTVEEAKLVSKAFNLLFKVPADSDVVDTLKYMNENGVSGVPLVDDTGKITQNFSFTDMLNLTSVNFPLLALPTKEFLLRVYGFIKPPVVCHKTDTVENILLKFACYGIHRVYVVDDCLHPEAVITLTDVMQFLLRAEARPGPVCAE